MKRSGSLKSLLESQTLMKKEDEDIKVSACICGEEPTKNTYGDRDHGATLRIPYYECKGCGIDSKYSGIWAYPGEWQKAAEGWNSFIANIKERIR